MRAFLAAVSALVMVGLVAATSGATTGGGFDAAFGQNGRALLGLGATAVLQGADVQADGKIVVGGATGGDSGQPSAGIVVRLGTDGRPDSSFGNGGRVPVPEAAYRGTVAVQRDQKIVYAGLAFSRSAPGVTHIHLERLNGNGSIDLGFGNGGSVDTDIGDVAPYHVLVAPGGTILVVGQIFGASALSDVVVARFTSDGRLDRSFGSGGRVTADWGGFDVPFGAALAPDGSIVVGGFREDANYQNPVVVVEKFTADGRIDNAFGANGVVLTSRNAWYQAGGVAVQSDGKVVVAGGDRFGVLRLTPTGKPDPTFGSSGVVELGDATSGVSRDVAVQSNGKIAVFGWTYGSNRDLFMMKRLLPNGSPDPAFTAAPADIQGNAFPEVVRIAPSGHLIGVGWTFKTADAETLVDNGTVLRYLPGTCSPPKLAGVRLSVVKQKLTASDCRLGRVKTIVSKRVAKGIVIGQTPVAGRQLPDWAFVDVTVSRGTK